MSVHNITHRDDDDVQDLFEEMLSQKGMKKSEWIKEKKREWLIEQGLDEDSADSLINEIDDDIRRLVNRKKELEKKKIEIDQEISEIKNRKDDLQKKKEKIKDLSGEVDLDDSDDDGSDIDSSRVRRSDGPGGNYV